MKTAEELAEEHWHNYICPLLEFVYITAFIHGAKHKEEGDC